ncbi:hypothetical protein SAMN04515674_11353 [Pseudarcicella hirudinis]|uniref:Cell division protein ZapB n=1 Tax=Pseudarcicella hirudinis TaxID=1079859 RepID=A0A1I5X0W2_9BACT|nr:hypothetical protein [Pseudarcicella hirudinis]SFQ25466.1 hypothetical protein SAMN04515674_11353 [Pseudarcicella hirudinis]
MEEYNPNRKSERKLKIAIAVLSALTFVLGFMYFREYQRNQKIESLSSTQKDDLNRATAKLDSISKQLDAKIIEINRLGGNVAELVKAKEQLEADKASLASSENFTMKKYDRKIRKYVALLGQKDKELIRLRKENGILAAKNDSLSKEAKNLLEGIGFAQKALSDSANRNKELVERSREIESRNRELAEKVSQAAALKAENINVYAISSKGKESEGGSYRSKKVDKIRVTFYLQENSLTTKEAKVIFMKIIDPSGLTVSDMNTGSGTFTFKGKEQTFTARQKILYDDSHQTVEFIYSKGSAYKEGRHTIELYSEGYLIGDGVFDVR